MLSSIKTTILFVMATTLFGLTEYGSQTISHLRGTATSTVDQGIDDLANKAHQYVKAIAPPETGHGYTLTASALTFAAFFVIVALYHEGLIRLMSRRWPTEDRKHIRWLSWNFVSMTFCWNAYDTCRFFGTFFTSCSSDSFLYTTQMIHGLDYVSCSSHVMMASLLMTAYFVYDLVFNKPNREYIYHHVLCLSCIGIYAWTQSYAFYVAAACVTELSTIFLAASVLFAKRSKGRALVMIDFCVTFFVCRIILIGIILMMIWFTESGTRLVTTMSSFAALYILNIYWFVLITQKVVRVCKSVWGKKIKKEE
jgi:hypothetical protein